MSTIFASPAELLGAVGKPLGTSEWLTITQERVNGFADATDDHQWIHVDPERAAAGPYGATIAHGYLTLSLIPQFAQQLFALDFGVARINYGANKIRFPAPVPVGSALRATATVTDVADGAASCTVTVRYVVAVDGAAKPACVAETLVVVA